MATLALENTRLNQPIRRRQQEWDTNNNEKLFTAATEWAGVPNEILEHFAKRGQLDQSAMLDIAMEASFVAHVKRGLSKHHDSIEFDFGPEDLLDEEEEDQNSTPLSPKSSPGTLTRVHPSYFHGKHEKKKSLHRSRVEFSAVEIRQYESIIGDNPACSKGPSISIGWTYEEFEVIPIDSYESSRQRHPRVRKLSEDKRWRILERLGYTSNDIVKCIRQAETIKRHRRQTMSNNGKFVHKVEEALLSAARKLSVAFSTTGRAKG